MVTSIGMELPCMIVVEAGVTWVNCTRVAGAMLAHGISMRAVLVRPLLGLAKK